MALEPLPRKDHWHSLSLQQLCPERLVSVVNSVLAGHLNLVSSAPSEAEGESPAPPDRTVKRERAVQEYPQQPSQR
jgi:hypothetical protein